MMSEITYKSTSKNMMILMFCLNKDNILTSSGVKLCDFWTTTLR